jgi:hypothetical protein
LPDPNAEVDLSDTMTSRISSSRDDATLGIISIPVGAVVRVESETGVIWSAKVGYVSDRLIGLRGWMSVEGQFRERDTVTLLIGHGGHLVSARARVLAAAGSLMRLVRRDASEDLERRRSPRLRVELEASLGVATDRARMARTTAELVDLSDAGCAISSPTELTVGTFVLLTVSLNEHPVHLAGTVVRAWTVEAHPYAGIRFDPTATPTKKLLNDFLVGQLRSQQPGGERAKT